MTIGSFLMTPSLASALAAVAGLIGLTLWWLLRKRQQRVWLPTMRVMHFESRLLPRLVLRPPPLLAFLAFLVSLAALLGFALRPRTQIFTPFEPNQARILLFCAMDPSVSARLSLSDYASRVGALYDSLKDRGRISLATSHSLDVVEPQSSAEVEALIKARGFHRAGLRLGTALKALLKERSEIDRLFILADRNQHVWADFNWRYLLDEMSVVFYDLGGAQGERSGPGTAVANYFVNDARFLSSPAAPTMDWDVEIGRRGATDAAQGTLTAVYMGKTLGSFPWQIPAGAERLTVRASWPGAAAEQAGGEAKGDTGGRDVPLVFKLAPQDKDAMAADNEFRSELKGVKQDVLLLSESSGERALEDPAQQLEVALSIQGFRLQRLDFLKGDGPPPEDFPLFVLLGGSSGSVDRFCPRSLVRARLGASQGSGTQRSGARVVLPKVWLAPQTLAADYHELCLCYSRLLSATSVNAGEPAYCQNLSSRAQWAALLPALGAKQVGGELGDAAKALAWHQRDAKSGLDILAFSVPLLPSLATGLNYAQMPILIKELLTWQGLLAGTGTQGSGWPRLDDIAAALWQPPASVSAEELARERMSNVPLGESLLEAVDEASLPPRWSPAKEVNVKESTTKKDREDPLPWLKLAALMVVGAGFLEGGGTLFSRLSQWIRSRRRLSLWLACGLAAGLAYARPAAAKVELARLGDSGSGGTRFDTLAREVSHRTSIELEPKALSFAHPSPEALSEPWLWVDNFSTVTGPGGALTTDVATWLRRGGLLIIESPWTSAQLAKLTQNLAVQPGEGWQALPPDHELMRSFYLLDALPGCNGEIWRGFQFDGRLAILAMPYPFLATVAEGGHPPNCANAPDQERSVRVFVNLIMVALATDYKRDQIHLPEILKRLR